MKSLDKYNQQIRNRDIRANGNLPGYDSLKGQYPQVLRSILLVGKLLQIFGFFLLPALAMH